ncbi:MAG TPA: prepilin-type N-terminal cleavage/methylation domain-containing protein [Thermoanaerobaculia bacterium]|nr:prepilin-type N-terminal cleavage/methylation domain-containing protein [Thermoanaerobaculia bacterium]
MRSQKGFTLVETLVALLILTLVVTTSLAFFTTDDFACFRLRKRLSPIRPW